MSSALLVGIDVGATSIKAGAFKPDGRCVALATRPNHPHVQPGGQDWLVWDADLLRSSVEETLREVTTACPQSARVAGVAVTGFGADGAPFSAAGEQRYPIISWHDSRAASQARALEERIGTARIYATTGYHVYPMNTLVRWRWLVENEPATLDGATWLMVPDIVVCWLSGEMRSEPTGSSTTMAFDLAADAWSSELFEAAGVSPDLPAQCAEPGERIGSILPDVAERTGLPAGTPVVVGGHDCEVGTFAASGGLPDEAFVDIAGTWEILAVPCEEFRPDDEQFARGIDWERHVLPGSFICQALMPGGSVIGWVRDFAYGGSSTGWGEMIADARSAQPGAGGVTVVPAFVDGVGPFARAGISGALLGLRTHTTRAQVARAAFESLCFQVRSQVEVLEAAVRRPSRRLRVLGGGRRNDFWLQLKADVTGRVVEAVETEELTLLGAALLAGVGGGVYASREDAQSAVQHKLRIFSPDPRQEARYTELYEGHRRLPTTLAAAAEGAL